VLSCPKGIVLSLTWLRNGEALPDIRPGVDVAHASDREGQLKLFQKNFGQWQLRGEIGRGKQRGAVFQAEGRGGRAAVKFPVSVREIQHLSALQGVAGVPELLDYSNGPQGGPFHVTPILGESLEGLLRCREDSGMGSRISWSAARALGRSLLATLQGIHERGVIHCDLSPLNVLVGPRCCPFLIDFGQSRALGSAHCEKAEGTVEYNSIRAGYPGQRTPADDLESLGWVMWRCVVGPLPWRDLPGEVDWRDRRARQRVYERVSQMKQRLLEEGFDALGECWAYCPDGLQEYLRRTWLEANRGYLEVASAVYKDLASLLDCPDGEQHWADVATSKPRTLYEARHDRLLWRPLEAARLLDAEASPVAEFMRVMGTGGTEIRDGGLWAQLDPVWLPGLPTALCQRGGWALVADWAGQLLWRVPIKGEYIPQVRAAPSTKTTEPAGDAQEGGFAREQEEEEDDDECRWLKAVAADAALQYSRTREPAVS